MAITCAKLLPKAGYVEVEQDGKRVYKKVSTDSSQELEEVKQANSLLGAQLQAQTERSDFIEDCIAEMAMQVYAE